MDDGVAISMVSSSCISLVAVGIVMCLFVAWIVKQNKDKREAAVFQENKRRAIQSFVLTRNRRAGTPPSILPPPQQTAPYVAPGPSQPSSAQQAETAMRMFEFDNNGETPTFEEFKDMTFVGRTLETLPDDKQCWKRCHANKYCSHVEVDGDRCIFKNRQMAMFDGDADMINFLGFEPLPECTGKKCMDGYKSGVTTWMHPKRMEHKPQGADPDKLKGYREAEKMHRQMNKAITCDSLCKFAKAMNIIGVVFLFAGAPGMVGGIARAAGVIATSTATRLGTAFVAAEIAVAGLEIGAAVPNAKAGARNQKALEDSLQSLVENPSFIYHNIRGKDLERARNGVDCVQQCNLTKNNGQLLLYGLAELNKPENLDKKNKFNKEGERLVNVCCGPLSTDDRRKCASGAIQSVGGFIIGDEKMCTSGNNMLNSLEWAKLPEVPNNFSDTMFKFFKKTKTQLF